MTEASPSAGLLLAIPLSFHFEIFSRHWIVLSVLASIIFIMILRTLKLLTTIVYFLVGLFWGKTIIFSLKCFGTIF